MKLKKRFNSFHEGILELTEVSYSVEQALNDSISKKKVSDFASETSRQLKTVDFKYTFPQVIDSKFLPLVVLELAINAVYGSELYVYNNVVDYTTTGGLKFGWDYIKEDSEYIFYIQHPSGKFPKGSTLLKAGLDAGWEVE